MKLELASLLASAAERWGDERAIDFDTGPVSYACLDAEAARFAGGLAAAGIGRADRVTLYLPNSHDWLIAYHAVARMGAVIVPANILLSAAEVRFLTADSGSKALICPDGLAQEFARLADVLVTPGGALGSRSFAAMMAAPPLPPCEVGSDDLFTIGYTSGTTGTPKGVMLSHRNIASSVANTATTHVRHAGDRVYSALPLSHVYGNVVMNASLLSGAYLTVAARFDAGAALATIAERRITLFEGVPTMYHQILAHPSLASTDLTSLTRCTVGGQTMPAVVMDEVARRFGCPLLELWGMTEVGGPATTHSPYWPRRHGSIGLPFPGTQVRIARPASPDENAPDGEPGEMMVRGPLVMAGYWNRPEATAETIDASGWLATGDITIRDAEGYLYIVDRKKDMILTAGYNVYPAEIEAAIARHECVAMVAVAGFADAEKGELAHAFVVLHSGSHLSAAALLDHCRRYLASYKIPRGIHFVEDLPKTSSGKIQRRALRRPQDHP
jgi:long-chain acyl-CoA synthetase